MSLPKASQKKNTCAFSSDKVKNKKEPKKSSGVQNQTLKSPNKEEIEEIHQEDNINEFKTELNQIKPKPRNPTKVMQTFKKSKTISNHLKKSSSITSTSLLNELNKKEDNNVISTPDDGDPNKEGYDVKQLPTLTPTQAGSIRGNIRVYARVRPINEVEADLLENKVGILCIENVANNLKNDTIIVKNANGFSSGPYTFDRIFSSETPQESVYNVVGKEIAQNILSGYNGTIFAYGQSGSGKTHTMYGQDIHNTEQRGIIPRLISDLFHYVDTTGESITFEFKMSILQIYKEIIYDLLTGERDLKIKENPLRGIYVEKLTEVYINTIESFMSYVDLAINNRIVSETKLNSTSSRSHSILILEVTQTFVNENYTKKGTLNLVDLAGSEKISKTGAVGETLEEAKKINLSLSSLGHVIHSLTSGADHIPYRDSKLTRILQESLGGNFKTSLIVTCSPHSYHFEETVSSFQFAQRAKFIKNKVKINIKLSYEELQKIITQLRKALSKANNEIIRLKGLLPPGTEINIFSLDEDSNRNNTQPEMVKEMSTNNLNSLATKPSIEKDTMTPISKTVGNTLHSMINTTPENESISLKEISEVKDLSPFRNSHLTQEDKLISAEALCSNCIKNKDVIKQWKDKIESLKNKIKEKDDIISALNRSNDNKFKQINELKTKLKLNPKAMNDTLDDDTHLKTIEELYNEIKSKLSNIETKQIESNKYGFGNSKINELTPQLIKDLQNLYSINTKTSFNDSSNGHILLLNSVTNLLSKALGIFKDQSSSDIDFTDIAEVFKSKTAEIFDAIFIFSQRDIDKISVDNLNKELKTQLLHLNCVYLFGYLQAYSILQVQQQLNQKLINQNNILRNINLILITIVEDLLRSNIDISQKCNIMGIEKLRSSIIGKTIIVTDTDEYDNIRKQSFADIPTNQPFQRAQGRIMTLVNKNSQVVSKNVKDRLSGYNFISQLNRNNICLSFIQGSNQIMAQRKSSDYQDDIKINSNNGIGLFSTQNPILFANEGKQSMQPQIEDFSKKQEKKRSKLILLKEYIVKAIQQSENYKNELKIIKDHLINLVQVTQSNILSKLSENGLIKEISINYDICLDSIDKKELSLDEEIELSSSRKTRNKLLNPLLKKFDSSSIPFSDNNEQKHALNRYMTMTCDSQFKRRTLQSEQSQRLFKHASYDFNYLKTNQTVNQKNIEALIEDYLEIGTATRKFDGISVKYEGSKVKCSYEGGLNAKNTIYSIPIHNKLSSNAGDTSQVLVSDDTE